MEGTLTAPVTREAGAPSFSADLRREFRRLLRPPFDELGTVAFNALLVCIGWFLLPRAARDWLFDLHGPLAFALVLEYWMLSDTPATNLLGNDPVAAVAALDSAARLRRLFRVKATALALLVGPISAAACVVIATRVGRTTDGIAEAVALLALPFGVAAVSPLLGVFLPYRRLSLRQRWAQRRPWARTVRWGLLLVAPYTWVSAVAAVLLVPGAGLVGLMLHRHHRTGHLTGPPLTGATGVVVVVAVVAFVVGTWATAGAALRRSDGLRTFLSSPDHG